MGLSGQCVSAPDAVRDVDDNENDDADDNALVLACDQLQQVNRFRELLDRTDDTDQLQLCAEKCSERLRHHTSVQILIAAYDDGREQCAASPCRSRGASNPSAGPPAAHAPSRMRHTRRNAAGASDPWLLSSPSHMTTRAARA